MPSLITMAVHDTEDNDRTWMTRHTLMSLGATVDFGQHTLMVSDNGSCEATREVYKEFANIISFIEWNGTNIGTANALNKLWRHKQPFHRCIVKIDNDVELQYRGWLDTLELVFRKAPDVAIAGLKRMDVDEWPDASEVFYRSTLRHLPHEKGEPWLIVEECEHIMGTCQAYRAALVGDGTQFGYLWQPGPYGLDDSLASFRMHRLGYKTVFVHHAIPLLHVDPGGTDYIRWKDGEARRWLFSGEYDRIVEEYRSGKRPLYYDGGVDEV